MTSSTARAADAAPAPMILIVDDDTDLRQHTAAYLAEHGYGVRSASGAAEMDRALAAGDIGLILLDVMMPGEDGLSICRRLRDANGPPVIIISAMGDEIDRIVGLELGADDYIAKPSSPRELLARIKAVLRRRIEVGGAPATGRAYAFAGFRLDLVRRHLRGPGGVAVMLTGGEFSLLCAFLERPQRILTREELLDFARGSGAEVFDRAIDVQISRLRSKLLASSGDALITTVRGLGYMLDERVTLA